jgi:hypothetical protein
MAHETFHIQHIPPDLVSMKTTSVLCAVVHSLHEVLTAMKLLAKLILWNASAHGTLQHHPLLVEPLEHFSPFIVDLCIC